MKEKMQLGLPQISTVIHMVRGRRVILDEDLARIYGITTREQNQAVKRNNERFPEDFMFQLTPEEVKAWDSLRSQNVILKTGGGRHP